MCIRDRVSNDLIAAKTLGSLAGTVPMPGYDVEKAREYLAASNYKEGDVLTPVSYTHLCISS